MKEVVQQNWTNCPKYLAFFVPLGRIDYPPSFIGDGWGHDSPEDFIEKTLCKSLSVYEDEHPLYKGQLVEWRVVHHEVYFRSGEDCAHEAVIVFHCDRIGTPMKCECPKCAAGGSCK